MIDLLRGYRRVALFSRILIGIEKLDGLARFLSGTRQCM